ncbi:MAG: hypothetical protein VB088_08655, partial [Sphaerochaeta sp.]|nr:hypothetical protein [Sphaerochaeta sp.]
VPCGHFAEGESDPKVGGFTSTGHGSALCADETDRVFPLALWKPSGTLWHGGFFLARSMPAAYSSNYKEENHNQAHPPKGAGASGKPLPRPQACSPWFRQEAPC